MFWPAIVLTTSHRTIGVDDDENVINEKETANQKLMDDLPIVSEPEKGDKKTRMRKSGGESG